jgi:hypothetical protein
MAASPSGEEERSEEVDTLDSPRKRGGNSQTFLKGDSRTRTGHAMNGSDGWFKPKLSPPPPRQPKPRNGLWTIAKNGHTYTCELVFHDQGGTEAQIMKDGELIIGRRFEEGWQTLQWATFEKEHIEKGGD